jgi:hypothetical protein
MAAWPRAPGPGPPAGRGRGDSEDGRFDSALQSDSEATSPLSDSCAARTSRRALSPGLQAPGPADRVLARPVVGPGSDRDCLLIPLLTEHVNFLIRR